MTEKTKSTFTEAQATEFDQIMDNLNIPAEDISEGLDFITDFMKNRPLPSRHFATCLCSVAVAAYHAGKKAAE